MSDFFSTIFRASKMLPPEKQVGWGSSYLESRIMAGALLKVNFYAGCSNDLWTTTCGKRSEVTSTMSRNGANRAVGHVTGGELCVAGCSVDGTVTWRRHL